MIFSAKYEVLATLGQGGMGQVYLVRHRSLGTVYALKVLLAHFAHQPELVQRFHNEARIMARLQHPNIVRVFDIDRDGEQYYFVMEYIEGDDLQQIIAQRAPLPVAELCRIGRPIGQALAHAHARTVVHRDIKPSNILVERDSGRVVVTDFGVAKLLDSQDTRLTSTGMILGTLRYAAPEQLRGAGDIDPRSDIFSLGMVLFELATGRPFFDGLSNQAIIGRQLYEPADNLPELPTDTPLRHLIGRCIHKDREQRYPDIAALLDELAQLDQTRLDPDPDAPHPNAPIRADPATRPIEHKPVPRRGRRVVFAMLIMALVYAGWRWLPERTPPPPTIVPENIPEPADESTAVSSTTPASERPATEPAPSESIPPKPVRPAEHEPPSDATQALTDRSTAEPVPSEPIPPQPVHSVEREPPADEVQALVVRPATGELTLATCQPQIFRVDSEAERFRWLLDGAERPERGARLELRLTEPGEHRLQVTGSAPQASHRWHINVVSDPPDEQQAGAWLEQYRQALERKAYARLQTLGFSAAVVERLRRELESRQRYSVHLENLRGTSKGDELHLNFSRVERWYDPETYSTVVNYTTEQVRLQRAGCERIIAQSD